MISSLDQKSPPDALKTEGVMSRNELLDFFEGCNARMAMPEVKRELREFYTSNNDESKVQDPDYNLQLPNHLIIGHQRNTLRLLGFDPDFGITQLNQMADQHPDDRELQSKMQVFALSAQFSCQESMMSAEHKKAFYAQFPPHIHYIPAQIQQNLMMMQHQHTHGHGGTCNHDHGHEHSHERSHDHGHSHKHGENCNHDHGHSHVHDENCKHEEEEDDGEERKGGSTSTTRQQPTQMSQPLFDLAGMRSLLQNPDLRGTIQSLTRSMTTLKQTAADDIVSMSEEQKQTFPQQFMVDHSDLVQDLEEGSMEERLLRMAGMDDSELVDLLKFEQLQKMGMHQVPK